MKKIIITNEPKQKININNIVIYVTFRPLIEAWVIDIFKDNEPVLIGKRICVGILILRGLYKDFDFLFKENDGLDPFKIDDFEKRVSCYFLEKEDLKKLRGYDVKSL